MNFKISLVALKAIHCHRQQGQIVMDIKHNIRATKIYPYLNQAFRKKRPGHHHKTQAQSDFSNNSAVKRLRRLFGHILGCDNEFLEIKQT